MIARFVQGCVSGPLIPLSQSLMLMSFPREKRNLALVIGNMIAIVGPIAGPILGGWIAYNYLWPWIFFINIPIGIFCAIVIPLVYKDSSTSIEKIRLDKWGLFLLVLTVSSFQIFLDKGETLDWWNARQIWMLACTSFLSFLFFSFGNGFKKIQSLILNSLKIEIFLLEPHWP